jgi:leucyl-tRNA synthetase
MAEFAKATEITAEEAAAEKEARYLPTDGSMIDYGPSSCNFAGVEGVAETYYISTAIAYTNGYPHMGHAYESLTSDVAARYHRILGYDTLFCTGRCIAFLSILPRFLSSNHTLTHPVNHPPA